MARTNPTVRVEVDWDGDGSYSHALSDVSASADLRFGHGTNVTSVWYRPVVRSCQGSMSLPADTYLPGRSGGQLSQADGNRRNSVRVTVRVGTTDTSQLVGIVESPKTQRRRVRWQVTGLLNGLLGEPAEIKQEAQDVETTDQDFVDVIAALLGLAAGAVDPPDSPDVELGAFEVDGRAGGLVSDYCSVASAVPLEDAAGSLVLGARAPASAPSPDVEISQATHRITGFEVDEDGRQVRNTVTLSFAPRETLEIDVTATSSVGENRPLCWDGVDDSVTTRPHVGAGPVPPDTDRFLYRNVRARRDPIQAADARVVYTRFGSSETDNSDAYGGPGDSGIVNPDYEVTEQAVEADGSRRFTLAATQNPSSPATPGLWGVPFSSGLTNDSWVSPRPYVLAVLCRTSLLYDRIDLHQPEGEEHTVTITNEASELLYGPRSLDLTEGWIDEDSSEAASARILDEVSVPPELYTMELPLAQGDESAAQDVADIDAGMVVGVGVTDESRGLTVNRLALCVQAGLRIRQGRPPVKELRLLDIGHDYTPPTPPPPPPPPPGPFGLASWAPPTGQVADVLALITAGSRAEPYRESSGVGVLGAGSDLELEGISPAETINRVRITDSPQGNVRIRLNGTGSGDFGDGFNTGGTYEDGAVVVQTEDGSAVFSNPSEQQSEGASFLVMESSDADDNTIMDAITAGTKMLLAITRAS